MGRYRIFAGVLLIICIMLAGLAFAGIKQKLISLATTSSLNNSESIELPTLDSESEACLQCHNGADASLITAHGIGAALQVDGSGRVGGHPVGMIYEQHQEESLNKLIPRDALNSSIELIEGRVGCRSCHALKTPEEDPADCSSSDRLTVGGSLTALCLSCHIK